MTAPAWLLLGLAVAVAAQDDAGLATVKIVGLGATTCADFTREVTSDPDTERTYFAWAQGFMSGALARAPAGVDQGIDLTPPGFPLRRQAERA